MKALHTCRPTDTQIMRPYRRFGARRSLLACVAWLIRVSVVLMEVPPDETRRIPWFQPWFQPTNQLARIKVPAMQSQRSATQFAPKIARADGMRTHYDETLRSVRRCSPLRRLHRQIRETVRS